MAIIVVATTPGLTAEMYDQVLARQNLGEGLPPGCSAHIAGPSPDGWQVTAVWESPEAVTRFMSEVVRPIMQELGITPPAKPPVIYPLHNLVK